MIDLYTSPTPNGWKVSIMLEETGLPYTVKPIDLGKLVQKEEWFLELNQLGDPRVVLALLLALIGCGLSWREALRRPAGSWPQLERLDARLEKGSL